MSVSIVTIANLGKKTNLKTPGILPVIEELAHRGELKQVICQINTDFHFPNTYSAIPSFVRYPLRALEKILGLSFERLCGKLSHLFVKWRLEPTDIVIVHPPSRFGSAVEKAKRNGSTVVGIATVAHPLFDKEIHTEEHRKFESSLNTESFEKMSTLVKQFDYIIAISDFVKSSYIKYGFPSERVFVAYTDINLPPESEQVCRDNIFKVLYLSYTNARKGLPYLLDAWRKLKLPNAELTLVGKYSGDVPDKLKQYCDGIIKGDPSITWAGSTNTPEKYYGEASLFVFPSLTEGNPKVVMEAMSHGLPVITTKNAQSIVEDGKSGFVVPIRNAQALAEKIRYLYDSRDVAERMGKEARKAMEHKKPFGEAVFEIYQKILKRENGSR